MAEGDGAIYNNFKHQVMEKIFDLLNDTIKVALWAGYTPSISAHTIYANVTGTELSGTGYVAGGKSISGQAVTQVDGTDNLGKFDASDLTWTGINAGTPAYGVMYDDALTAAPVDGLIAYWEVTTATNGGDYTLQWHTDGIITLT